MAKRWSVYVVTCDDGRLYTGISNDVTKRLKDHNRGKGCKFTRGRLPVELAYREDCGTRSAATKRELEIQGLTRSGKLKLINSF